MRVHTVPADTFDLLASGAGDMGGVLRVGQRSKRLLLLRNLMAEAERRVPALFAQAGSAHAFAVVVEARRRSPHDVDALLLAPQVGAWATRCLRGLLTDGSVAPGQLGHLGAVAVVAARRAGQAFEVTTYLRDGVLTLPTWGAIRLPGVSGWCRVRSRAGADGIEIVTADATTVVVPPTAVHRHDPTWTSLRRLSSSAGSLTIDLLVDDLDPYRGCGHLPIADRLGPSAVEGWQDTLDDAWSLLVAEHRDRAEAIASGISTVVPLRPTGEATELSATCHEAIGTIAVTPPRTPLSLALALVHEFQHTKLSALLDLVPLLARHPDRTFYAPWRRDPRRLSGLLQGAYAYLGLTEFWEVHRRRCPVPSDDEQPGGAWAHFELALGCRQVRQAVGDLRTSGKLTPAGERFADGMQRRVMELSGQPVPPAARSLARLAALDHATSWRLRNLRPDPDEVEDAAEDWMAARTGRRSGRRPATVVDGTCSLASDGRVALFRRRLAFPSLWRSDAVPGAVPVTPADLLLVDGRFADAAQAYRSQIESRPDDPVPWAGLVLARGHVPAPGAKALTEMPELVAAVHEAVRRRSGASPDPDALARWLAREPG